MNKRVVYKTDDGGVAIVIPSPEALKKYTIQEIAIKDVPNGKPFKIVDVSEIPSDRSERQSWEVNESDLTDGVGGVS